MQSTARVSLSQLFLSPRSHSACRVQSAECVGATRMRRSMETEEKKRVERKERMPRKQVFVFSCKSLRRRADWGLKHIFLYSLLKANRSRSPRVEIDIRCNVDTDKEEFRGLEKLFPSRGYNFTMAPCKREWQNDSKKFSILRWICRLGWI